MVSTAGIPCGHERTFNAGISWHYVRTGRFIAESSAFAAPYLDTPICREAKIIHIVRHPLNVIRSWLYGTGKWGERAMPFFVEHLQGGLWADKRWGVPLEAGVTSEKNPDWLAGLYIAWNKMIEMRGRGRVCKAEDGPKLLQWIPESNDDQVFDDRHYHSHSKKKDFLDWDIVKHDALRGELKDLCLEYGYKEDPSAALPEGI